MRILLLTQCFDPEPTFKGLLFARELATRGYELARLTGFPNARQRCKAFSAVHGILLCSLQGSMTGLFAGASRSRRSMRSTTGATVPRSAQPHRTVNSPTGSGSRIAAR